MTLIVSVCNVSVPLRGFRHESFYYDVVKNALLPFTVSVPLRGFRHESFDCQIHLGKELIKFPSPCGVLGMKVALA